MTTRDEIAKGHTFYEMPPEEGGRRCVCGESAICDRDTGLCRPCWRAWLFGTQEGAWRVVDFSPVLQGVTAGVNFEVVTKPEPENP